MIVAWVLMLVVPAALVVGFLVGRRFEAAHHRVAGLLAAGERDTAINDEAENGWAL